MDSRDLTGESPRRRGRPRGPTRVSLCLHVLPTTEQRVRGGAFKAGLSMGEYVDRVMSTRRDEAAEGYS